jgi:long-chain acyl-CoA synthetase
MATGVVQSGARRVALERVRERAARAATGLAALGVGEADSVALLLRNDFPFLESLLGATRLGAYTVPINWHYKAEEIRYVLADSGARHLVAHADLLRAAAGAVPDGVTVLCVPTPEEVRAAYGIGAGEAAPPGGCLEWEPWLRRHPPWDGPSRPPRGTMFYTSGTTGRPKGVRRNAVAPGDRQAFRELRKRWFGHRPGMRTAMIGPMYHSVQTSYATAAVGAGGSVFLLPKFDPEAVLRLIDEERLTHLHLVPIMMRRLLQLPAAVCDRYDLSSLEIVVHGAAPCPPEVKRRMIEWWGPIIHEYYGTTEAGMISRADSEEWLARPGTVGRPWPGRIVRIYGERGEVLPAHREGEIFVSLGILPDFTYHNAADKRAAIERDGLVTNGDVGYLDDDGYLYLSDRKNDVMITGGVNVCPVEIEDVLARHPRVVDCAVFGVPDDEFGEVPAAVVELAEGDGGSDQELKAFVRARLADFKVPRWIEVRDRLPRDDSGKISKHLLREPYWARAGRRI